MHDVEKEPKNLVIVGAGPYGLAVGHAAKEAGLDYVMLGSPLSMWHSLPQSMPLRTKMTSRFDPLGRGSFNTFLRERGMQEDTNIPIARETFIEYVGWVQAREPLNTIDEQVTELSMQGSILSATLSGGASLRAAQVVVATGAVPHVYIPKEVQESALPFAHSLQVQDYGQYAGAIVCVVGGGQSAFESAVLAAESGAKKVYVIYPHETPRFERSQWGWLAEEIARVQRGELFASLPTEEQQMILQKFYEEGRAKIEPSLEVRAERARLTLVPHTSAGDFLRSGVEADTIICATGFKPHLDNIDFIAPSIRSKLAQEGGYPVLSPAFESSVPGLFFAGMLAAGSFGPLVEYMHGSAAAAQTIVKKIAQHR